MSWKKANESFSIKVYLIFPLSRPSFRHSVMQAEIYVYSEKPDTGEPSFQAMFIFGYAAAGEAINQDE